MNLLRHDVGPSITEKHKSINQSINNQVNMKELTRRNVFASRKRSRSKEQQQNKTNVGV